MCEHVDGWISPSAIEGRGETPASYAARSVGSRHPARGRLGKRVEGIDARSLEVGHVPGHDGKLVRKGGRRDESVADWQRLVRGQATTPPGPVFGTRSNFCRPLGRPL